MLTKQEFAVMTALLGGEVATQREIAQKTGISLGAVNAAVSSLREKGFIAASASTPATATAPASTPATGAAGTTVVTPAGMKALEPHKVDNAIIMAAGLSSRFAPISYEKPKGVLRVRDEVLIERQIRQLQAAGITDITVVVGYMKEQFFYLEEAFGVEIRINEQYAVRNNNSTLMLVKEKLGNTYICSSDDYFTENVFEPYVYEAYYAAEYFEGETDEYCITTGAHGVITKVVPGGRDSYCMLGHAYFDRAYSKKFVEILEAEYDRPETAGKLWEDIYIEHIDELRMVIRTYPKGLINEFDSLDELNGFDPAFLDNVDSAILDNICAKLDCKRADIVHIKPLKKGLTNLSFRFECAGQTYVYRHPGDGIGSTVNRQSEAFAEEVARDLGLDATFIFEDPQAGWKISRFIDDCELLDYRNPNQVKQALSMIRKLHECGKQSPWTFDMFAKAQELIDKLETYDRASFKDFTELYELIERVNAAVANDGVAPVLCHNDFYSQNILVAGNELYLIDWEYAGMGDYANDLGTFVCCSDYSYDEALEVLALYFQRKPTADELAHCVAHIALTSYYWFVWALYKDASGYAVGEGLYQWYKAAKLFGRKAEELLSARS